MRDRKLLWMAMGLCLLCRAVPLAIWPDEPCVRDECTYLGVADDFAAEVAQMCAITIAPAQWSAFLDVHVPRVDTNAGQPLKGRAMALAERKRDALNRLYRHDQRVAPWAGTGPG